MKQNNVDNNSIFSNGVKSDIKNDAWGRAKAINDFSIFHALFTFEVPWRIWLGAENWSEIIIANSTKIKSIKWTLEISSWVNNGDHTCIRSRRNPRYQPNRGHLYSTTIFAPSPSNWLRRWGLYTQDIDCNAINWAFFELSWGVLYAVIYSWWVEFKKEEIDISGFNWIDLAKWHLYDIQFQWRWVWDYFFFINQKVVHKILNLWTLDYVSIENPALPWAYTCLNTDGAETILRSWCLDITSEGGKKEWLTYTWISNLDDVAVTSKTPPVWMLVVHNKSTHKTKLNTRDVKLLRMLLFTDQNSRFLLYFTRDITAFTDLVLVDRYDDSVLQFHDSSGWNFTVDFAKLDQITRWSLGAWVPFDLWNPSEDIEFIVQPWDYLVLMWEKKSTNALMSWTMEFWEEL